MLISGTNVIAGTRITAFGTGRGGIGTYTVSASPTIAVNTTITGTFGAMAYSYDGINWNNISSPFSSFVNGIAYSSSLNMCIAVGVGLNTIAYSYDCINWIGLGVVSPTTPFTGGGYDISWNGFRWVAVGTGTNTVAYSSDGITWIGLGVVSPTTPFTSAGNAISWSGTTWVAVGTGTNTVAYSSDGITWIGLGLVSPTTPFTTTGNDIGWSGTTWVASGSGTNSIAYSSNGITWTGLGVASPISPFTTSGNGVKWTGTRWIATGQGTNTIAWSNDGIRWKGSGTSIFSTVGWNIAHNNRRINKIIYPKNTLVAVGENTIGSYSYNDGVNWTSVTISFLSSGRTSSWNGSIWVVGGISSSSFTGAIPVSSVTLTVTGTVTGNPIALGMVISGTNVIPGTIISAFGTGTGGAGTYTVSDSPIVAVNTTVTGTIGSLGYSYDGLNWFLSTNSIFSVAGKGLCWNDHMWIAVGEGNTNTIAYSYDGINWIGLGNSIFSIAGGEVSWNGSIFVAVGEGTNTIALSNDGINWTGLGTSIFSVAGNGLCWTGTRWIIVGNGTNSIAYSHNGIDWTAVASSTSIIPIGNKVASNQSFLIAVGGTFTASFTGAIPISSFTLTVSGTPTGNITLGMLISGTNVIAGTRITAFVTGRGGIGTYTVSASPTIAVNTTITGTAGAIAYSYDGIIWVNVYSPFTTIGQCILWTGSRWVAGGSGTNTYGYSFNGINWTVSGTVGSVNNISSNFNIGSTIIQHPTLALGNGLITQIGYSIDGINFTEVNISNIMGVGYGLSWNGKMWIVVGTINNTIMYSNNGINWTGLGSTIFNVGKTVHWNGSIWVAGGQSSTTGIIAYSYDGLSWNISNTDTFSASVNSIYWNGSIWVAVGEGGISTFTGSIPLGSNILTVTSPVSGTPIKANMVIRGTNIPNDTYIVSQISGTPGGIGTYTVSNPITVIAVNTNITGIHQSLAYSPDGINWTGVPFTFGSDTLASCNGVSWGKDKFVAVGETSSSSATSGIIIYSYDGITWKTASLTIFTFKGLCVTNNGKIWVAGGEGGNTIAYSSNGINWTGLGTSILSSRCSGICWNGLRYIANGYSPVSFTGTITGNLLTVTLLSIGSGKIGIGMYLTGTNVATNTTITGIVSTPTIGDIGTYLVNISQTVPSTTISGSITFAHSNDGITWYPNGINIFGTGNEGKAISSNSRIGPVVVDSTLVLDNYGYGLSSSLDIFSDSYYNNGYNNFTFAI